MLRWSPRPIPASSCFSFFFFFFFFFIFFSFLCLVLVSFLLRWVLSSTRSTSFTLSSSSACCSYSLCFSYSLTLSYSSHSSCSFLFLPSSSYHLVIFCRFLFFFCFSWLFRGEHIRMYSRGINSRSPRKNRGNVITTLSFARSCLADPPRLRVRGLTYSSYSRGGARFFLDLAYPPLPRATPPRLSRVRDIHRDVALPGTVTSGESQRKRSTYAIRDSRDRAIILGVVTLPR